MAFRMVLNRTKIRLQDRPPLVLSDSGPGQLIFQTKPERTMFSSVVPKQQGFKIKNHTWKALGVIFFSSVTSVGLYQEGKAENWFSYKGDHNTNKTIIGNLPRTYNRASVHEYWKQRPISIVKRLGNIIYELGPIAMRYMGYAHSPFASGSTLDPCLQEQIIRALARDFTEAITNLGPAWIKAGQQLAIRPDLVHPIVLKELQKLCDAVRTTMSEETAKEILESELGPEQVKKLQGLELVASASLGQVYKAELISSNDNGDQDIHKVAIKIQRPGMLKSFSLDLFLLQKYGDCVDSFTSIFTKQLPFHRDLFDSFSQGSYSELDYELEAQNQCQFQRELAERGMDRKVKIPSVFLDYTTRRIITTEWIDGVPLANTSTCTIQKLIPVGVELFLTQLLDIGCFHADPHPGNLLVTSDEGILCLLDFGLCAKVSAKERAAMTKALVNLLYRDFDKLVTQNTKELGFLPNDFDTEPLKPVIIKILSGGILEAGSNMHTRKRKLMEISSELNEIFFQYPFSVPPFFALVTRGLGLLEGIALSGDPEFDIFKASLPFVTSKRALSLLLSSSAGGQEKGMEKNETRVGFRKRSKKLFAWFLSK